MGLFDSKKTKAAKAAKERAAKATAAQKSSKFWKDRVNQDAHIIRTRIPGRSGMDLKDLGAVRGLPRK